MKHLGVWLATLLTVIVVLSVMIFSFLPPEETPEPTATLGVTPEIVPAPLIEPPAPVMIDQTALAQREAAYQAQISQLDQALQTRQATYQGQMEMLNSQLALAQQQVDSLRAQEQEMLTQAAQLEATRAERLAAYQSQLEQARSQYNTRYAEAQATLNQVQTQLAEARNQLQR